jgi:hypothetical protein
MIAERNATCVIALLIQRDVQSLASKPRPLRVIAGRLKAERPSEGKRGHAAVTLAASRQIIDAAPYGPWLSILSIRLNRSPADEILSMIPRSSSSFDSALLSDRLAAVGRLVARRRSARKTANAR